MALVGFDANREDPRDFVVANFVSLEDQLLKCMEFIPYVQQNHQIVSPKFIPILMDACSLIESVFRHNTEGNDRRSFKSYAQLHEKHLALEQTTSLLLVSPLQFFRPFHGWTTAVPSWWAAYNQIKHDRISCYAAASYTNTLTAFVGLHQVLARSWGFLSHLSRAGWFNESSEQFAELAAARCAGSGPPDMPVQSRLVVSAIRGEFVDWTQDPPTIDAWDFSDRVKTHIWEWEGWG